MFLFASKLCYLENLVLTFSLLFQRVEQLGNCFSENILPFQSISHFSFCKIDCHY